MGAWGPGLYQDDIADDVKSYYMDELKKGRENESITQDLINDNAEIIDDSDDAPVFWFALADIQWKNGRLLPDVKEKALYFLNQGSNLDRWQRENPREAKRRKEVLETLYNRLNSTQPPFKKITKTRLYQCEWKIGDVYAYLLESDEAKSLQLLGRYVLIIKVDEDTWYPGHIIPIVKFKITSGSGLPKDAYDINHLRYIPTGGIKGNPLHSYTYVMVMISTSKRIIPKKLIYLGNFPDLKSPNHEDIVKDKINIAACHWSDFEKLIIDHYVHYLC